METAKVLNAISKLEPETSFSKFAKAVSVNVCFCAILNYTKCTLVQLFWLLASLTSNILFRLINTKFMKYLQIYPNGIYAAFIPCIIQSLNMDMLLKFSHEDEQALLYKC